MFNKFYFVNIISAFIKYEAAWDPIMYAILKVFYNHKCPKKSIIKKRKYKINFVTRERTLGAISIIIKLARMYVISLKLYSISLIK